MMRTVTVNATKAIIIGALFGIALYLGGCTEATEQQASEEPTAEETTEQSTSASTEGEPCSKGPPQAVKFPISEDDKARAESEMAARPDEDWSYCYAIMNGPNQSGEVLSVAGILARMYPGEDIDEVARKLAYEQQVRAHLAQQKASGKNEAGQDVSNIPQKKMTPEQGTCFRNYFESLPRDQRGKEQQRVTAEANERGITPPEVVGC